MSRYVRSEDSPAFSIQRAALVITLVSAVVTALCAATPPEAMHPVQVHRTWMPNAYPSSYAIGFPGGLNFCFDPVRANVIYAWQGNYVDLTATVNGKIPRDAAIRGTTFYQSLTSTGFRTDNASAEPEIRFRVFRLKGAYPEFEYDVDGTRIRETVRPSAGGDSLVREFHVTTRGQAVTFRPGVPAELLVESGPAKPGGGVLQLPASSTFVFSLTLPRQ